MRTTRISDFSISQSWSVCQCATEIANVEKCVDGCQQLVFDSIKVGWNRICCNAKQARTVSIPSPAVRGFQRVDSKKKLSATFSGRLELTDHVDHRSAGGLCANSVCRLVHAETAGSPNRRLPGCQILRRIGGASSMQKTRHFWKFSWAALFVSITVQHPAQHSVLQGCFHNCLFNQITYNTSVSSSFCLPHVMTAIPAQNPHTTLPFLLNCSSAILDSNFINRMLFKELNYISYS